MGGIRVMHMCTTKIRMGYGHEKGAILVTGLTIMVLLSILVVTAMFMSNTEIMIAKNYEGSVQALYAAEAGAERVFDAFRRGDTNGDGAVNSADTANAANDLDGDGTIDYLQVFSNGVNMGSSTNRITLNANTDIQAFIWADAANAPGTVFIHSRGNPSGTKSRKEVTLTINSGLGNNILFGALNNST